MPIEKRARARRIQANRAAARLERGYVKALYKYNRKTGVLVSRTMTYDSAQTVIQERAAGLQELIKAWMKRVVFLFGPDVIDSLQERTGRIALEKKNTVDVFNEAVLLWLDNYSLAQVKTISGTLTAVAKQVLQQAFEQGLGEKATARLLIDKVGGTVRSAQRIARTEVHTATSIGSDIAARSTGEDMVKEWASTDDSRRRASHREANGQRREMDEPFLVGGVSLMYPGDPAGPAKEVINCRCVVLYHPRINGEVID